MASGVQQQADDLARYVAELSRRVATPRVRDLSDLADLVGHVRQALDGINPQEITWAVERATALIAALTALQETLTSVAELKQRFGDRPM